MVYNSSLIVNVSFVNFLSFSVTLFHYPPVFPGIFSLDIFLMISLHSNPSLGVCFWGAPSKKVVCGSIDFDSLWHIRHCSLYLTIISVLQMSQPNEMK